MPIYSYKCDGCGHTEDRVRPMVDRNKAYGCTRCAGGAGGVYRRDVSQELPNMLGTEKKFQPYFDVGVGKHIKTRAQQQREWDARGLVGLTKREFMDQYERGLANPTKPIAEKERKEKWKAATLRGAKRVYEKRRIVVSTA